MKRKVLSLLLALSMTASLAACGSTEGNATAESGSVQESSSTETESQEESTGEIKEPVTITLYPKDTGIASGKITGWIGDYLLEKGFVLEVLPYSDEKLNALLASGDLPDLVYLDPKKVDVQELGANGTLLNLDEHADKIPNIMESEMMQGAIEYIRDFYGDGKMTVLPLGIGQGNRATDTSSKAVKMNWEVYEEIGCPEFSNLEELIPIMKQMQEVHPETEDGVKTYGMHLSSDSDSDYFYGVESVFQVTGYLTQYLKYFCEADMVNVSYDYILEDDSNYKYAMWYINQLYREGLLDPDSITTEYLTQHAKIESGAAVTGWASLPGWEYSGYYPAYFDEVATIHNLNPVTFSGALFLGVDAESENLDAVLEFVNLLADPDTQRIILSGPQGEMWDVDESGKAYATEKGLGWFVDGESAVFAGGETYSLFNTKLFWGNGVMASDGQPVYLNIFDDVMAAKADNELMQRWQAHTGYENYLEQLRSEGTVVTENIHAFVGSSFLEKSDDAQSLIISAAKDSIVNGSWRMVYAKTDEEFEQIWDETVTECEKLGVRDIYEWFLENMEQAYAIGSEYAAK